MVETYDPIGCRSSGVIFIYHVVPASSQNVLNILIALFRYLVSRTTNRTMASFSKPAAIQSSKRHLYSLSRDVLKHSCSYEIRVNIPVASIGPVKKRTQDQFFDLRLS